VFKGCGVDYAERVCRRIRTASAFHVVVLVDGIEHSVIDVRFQFDCFINLVLLAIDEFDCIIVTVRNNQLIGVRQINHHERMGKALDRMIRAPV